MLRHSPFDACQMILGGAKSSLDFNERYNSFFIGGLSTRQTAMRSDSLHDRIVVILSCDTSYVLCTCVQITLCCRCLFSKTTWTRLRGAFFDSKFQSFFPVLPLLHFVPSTRQIVSLRVRTNGHTLSGTLLTALHR